MFKYKILKRSKFLHFLVFFFSGFFVFLMVIFYSDRMIAFGVNNFTDHRLSYDKWGKNLFDKMEIEGLHLELNNNEFVINVKKAWFDFKVLQLIKQKQLVLDCDMKGVSFGAEDENAPDGVSFDDILAIVFGPEQIYDKMIFELFLDKDIVKIADLKAFSENVRVKGDCTFFKKNEKISVNIKISFSPKISSMLDEDARKRVLSPEEGGWYSTVISYEGNAVFLRALYSLAA